MRAICLMAGECHRLRPLTNDTHKSMLLVKNIPIIDWQIAHLFKAGVTEIVLVVGHGSEKIADHIHNNHNDKNIILIKNTHYASKNLDYSLYCANDYLDSAFLYYEGDIIAHPSILKSLLNSTSDICLAVDSSTKSSYVDTLVELKNNQVSNLKFKEHGHLEASQKDVAGELICTIKFSDIAARKIKKSLQECSFTGKMQLYEIVSSLFSEIHTSYFDSNTLPWIEIDTQNDLERAERIALEFRVS